MPACPHCGHEAERTATECPLCGTSLGDGGGDPPGARGETPGERRAGGAGAAVGEPVPWENPGIGFLPGFVDT